MEVKIKGIKILGKEKRAGATKYDSHVQMYAKPQKVELVKVYPSYCLLEITTAMGYKRTECINNSALYDGEIELVDMKGRSINPWIGRK